jgi:6-pyruvoyltetrahydropterin/6-carboxytetrahydropterin synthase
VPTAYLTRTVAFTARHRLWRPDLDDAANAAAFGRAATDHEHRYECRVTVAGPLVAERAGVVHLGELDALLQAEVVARFEGRSINEAVAEFAPGRRLPTGEALAVYIWERLAARLPGAVGEGGGGGLRLHAVRVQEGPHLYSEYFGES